MKAIFTSTPKENIKRLAQSLSTIQWMRLCRLLDIPESEIQYDLRSKKGLLTSIQGAFSPLSTMKKKEESQ